MNFCMVGGLQGIVLRFEFHQHRLSGFGVVGVEICPFPLTWPLAYATACTTVQAVMAKCRIMQLQTTPHDSPGTLVFWYQKARQRQPHWRHQMQVG